MQVRPNPHSKTANHQEVTMRKARERMRRWIMSISLSNRLILHGLTHTTTDDLTFTIAKNEQLLKREGKRAGGSGSDQAQNERRAPPG